MKMSVQLRSETFRDAVDRSVSEHVQNVYLEVKTITNQPGKHNRNIFQ